MQLPLFWRMGTTTDLSQLHLWPLAVELKCSIQLIMYYEMVTEDAWDIKECIFRLFSTIFHVAKILPNQKHSTNTFVIVKSKLEVQLH